MSAPEQSPQQIRPMRWRATLEVEFTTRDYPVSEETGARHTASLAARGAQIAEQDINSSRTTVTLKNLERLDGQ